MARKAFANATMIPVLLAVGATGGAGWWLKRQNEAANIDAPPIQLRLDRLPKVTVRLAAAGLGSLPGAEQGWLNDTAGWARIEIRDDGVLRMKNEGRILGVFTDISDEEGRIWPHFASPYPGGLLVRVLQGYSKPPRKLTIRVTAARREVGKFDFLPLPQPKRQLPAVPQNAKRNGIAVHWERGAPPLLPRQLRVIFDRPLPKDKILQVGLIAHSFYRPSQTFWIDLPARAREMRIPSGSEGDTSGIEEVELGLRWYRIEKVAKRISLKDSYLRKIDGRPVLEPRPSRIDIHNGFTLEFSQTRAISVSRLQPRTFQLIIGSEGMVRSVWAKLVTPVPTYRGFSVFLANGLRTQAIVPEFFESPPILPSVQSMPFEEGPFPIEFDFRAQVFVLEKEERLILPIR